MQIILIDNMVFAYRHSGEARIFCQGGGSFTEAYEAKFSQGGQHFCQWGPPSGYASVCILHNLFRY